MLFAEMACVASSSVATAVTSVTFEPINSASRAALTAAASASVKLEAETPSSTKADDATVLAEIVGTGVGRGVGTGACGATSLEPHQFALLQLSQLSREKEHQSVVAAGASQEAQTSSVELQKQQPSKGVTVGFCEGRGDGDGVGLGVGLGEGAKT